MALRSNLFRTFGGSSNLTPGAKAPTLKTATIPINVETYEGQFFKIHATIGNNLWAELKNNSINIGGFCGGGEQDSLREKIVGAHIYGPYCAMCHCTVDQPWFDKLGEIHQFELEAMTEIYEAAPDNTRFACSIEVEKWMEEMIIRVPTFRSFIFSHNTDNSGHEH